MAVMVGLYLESSLFVFNVPYLKVASFNMQYSKSF